MAAEPGGSERVRRAGSGREQHEVRVSEQQQNPTMNEAEREPVLGRLARWCVRHRWLVVGFWVLALVLTNVANLQWGGQPSMDFRVPGSEFQKARDLLQTAAPGMGGERGMLVFEAKQGVDDPAVRTSVETVLDQIRAVPGVGDIVSPYETANPRAAMQRSKDHTVAFAEIGFISPDSQQITTPAKKISELVKQAPQGAARLELSGWMFQNRTPPGITEAVGIAAAIVILLLVFGSAFAMALPIVTALCAIGTALAGAGLLANVMSMPIFANQAAAMVGIGVGIDYALFIVTRYRNAMHHGHDPEYAIAIALRTSGKAVVFAGVTVIISMGGMLLMGLSFLYGLAAATVLAVALTMVASITLLPALVGFVGHRIDALALPWAKRTATTERNIWYRWSRLVQRRPVVMALVGLALLVGLAWPVFSIRLGSSDAGNSPTTDTTRRSYDLLSRGFGPGYNGSFFLAIDVAKDTPYATLRKLHDDLVGEAGVASVTPAIPLNGPLAELAKTAGTGGTQLNPAALDAVPVPSGTVALMVLTPTTAPQDQATTDLSHRLRPAMAASLGESGVHAYVGGVVSAQESINETLQKRLPLFIGAVLALSFVLLLVVFRSILVPVKAVIMNVLSIGAAYGLLVLVFQQGHSLGLDIGRPGPIESFLPMMLFAVVFGLSMDYEVFLLSRIREEYDVTHDNAQAVADGLSHTARVITAAAAIMVCVFGSFVFTDGRVLKEFGLGLAAAVFIDATIVRMILVPATMELLGDANWWLPRWLDRILPRISIEGDPDDHPVPA
jgi:RND superfamily putative drug exporter